MKCLWNNKLKCPHYSKKSKRYHCPLLYDQIDIELDRYFRGIKPEDQGNPEVFIKIFDKHYGFLKRAWIYKLFDEEGFPAVCNYYIFGVMTHEACEALHIFKRRYVLQQKKAFMELPSFKIGCGLAGIKPSIREVTLWWNHQGEAYRAWREYSEGMHDY